MNSKRPNSKGGERAERRRTDRAIEAVKALDPKPVRDPYTRLGVKRPEDVGTKELLLKIGILNTQLDLKNEYISNLEVRLDQVLAEQEVEAAEERGDAAEATTPEDVSESETAE